MLAAGPISTRSSNTSGVTQLSSTSHELWLHRHISCPVLDDDDDSISPTKLQEPNPHSTRNATPPANEFIQYSLDFKIYGS